MADLVIDVDAAGVLAMLEQLGDAAEEHVHAASRETAERVLAGAQSRVRRATGVLHDAITLEAADPRMRGYRVFVDDMIDARGPRADEFALWHEAGTQHMRAQPFMANSAAVEEMGHLRRLAEALQAAIDQENG